MANTKIVTHLLSSELSETFEKGGLLLPLNSLKTVEDFEGQIEYLLREMNPIELIQFSSFLNMICQSRNPDQTMVRGISLLEETGVVPKGARFLNKIVFHRDNLLNLISQILVKNIDGNQQLTGLGHSTNQKKYSEAILLNNDLLSLETRSTSSSAEILLRDSFVREWPHYYLPEIASLINKRRITRYRYCYETLLPTLNDVSRKVIQEGMRSFEEKSGVSIKEYMKVIKGLYTWYFVTPLYNEKNPPAPNQPKLGFDFMNPNSFYIAASQFEADPTFIKAVDILSRDVNALRLAAERESERQDQITGYSKNVRIFFDNPIFKISNGLYCVIDLKFLIENVCCGLLWRVKSEGGLQNLRSAYGNLMEEYFKFLINSIFKGAKICFGNNGGADAIVEQGDKIFVIEFTVEQYRQSSLYNSNCDEFLNDAYRILFSTGKKDSRARNKKDKGKLLKLNEYIDKYKSDGKVVIPVLITENLLGNPDFFNEFNNFYDREVLEKELFHLQQNQPLLLCLDDLETLWGITAPGEAVEIFAEFAKNWNTISKGPHFHNASLGICEFLKKITGKEAVADNPEYIDFFSNERFYN